jgi:hypothetical protein
LESSTGARRCGSGYDDCPFAASMTEDVILPIANSTS